MDNELDEAVDQLLASVEWDNLVPFVHFLPRKLVEALNALKRLRNPDTRFEG